MKKLGLATPQVLLPNKKINLKKWAVVACDQYNSNHEYWKGVERYVGNNASTLHIVLPEIYLSDNKEERILNITHEMEEYVAQGVVEALPPGFVLVQRELPGGTRTGLIAMVDLEKYHYKPRKDTKIRPTEQTVMERIPPRVEIRKPALLESPHILVLLNDPRKKVIEPLARRIKNFPTLYDFKLMENGGRIKGSFVGDKEEIDDLYQRLEMIADDSEILFAVGDGNHSLATAKTVWDEFKQELTQKQKQTHPKRFALVEVVNLYDEGLIFEPIHRVVFNVEPNALITDLVRIFNRKKMDAKVFFKRSTATKFVQNISGQSIDFVGKDRKGYIQIGAPANEMEAVNFQEVLDEYLQTNETAEVEYIHGNDELERLCEMPNTTGFVLPKLDKHSFVDVLAKHGVLPKKCFSLGEADEKRYYLETRLLDEIMEVDENDDILASMDNVIAPEPKAVLTEQEDQKKKWTERGNNEDIISLAFGQHEEEPDDFEVRNKYLLTDEQNPEDFLSKHELKKLKRQQRMDALLKEIDDDESGEDEDQTGLDGYLDEHVEEPPLSRKEMRLLKRQEEYELLLNEINKIKVEHAKADELEDAKAPSVNKKQPVKQPQDKTEQELENEAKFNVEKELEEYEQQQEHFHRLNWIQRIKQRREEKRIMLEEAIEALEQDDEKAPDEGIEVKAGAREKRAEKREERLDKKIERAHDQGKVAEELEDYEDVKIPLTRREQRALRRQEKLEALLKEVEQYDRERGVLSEDEPFKPSKKEERRNRKEAIRKQRIEEIEAFEKEAEAEYLKKAAENDEKKHIKQSDDVVDESDEFDEKALKKMQKLKRRSEIADALQDDTVEDTDLAEEIYVLEKARIRLEKEKIRLERFKIREETRSKVKIEREKRKQIEREKREAERQRQKEELEQVLADEMGILPEAEKNKLKADGDDHVPLKETNKRTQRRRFSEVIDDIVHEVTETDRKTKEPEKVIVRKDTNEVIGRAHIRDNNSRGRREKKRRGTILVKRAGRGYSKQNSGAKNGDAGNEIER